MNIPKGWKLARSESYGTLFHCAEGHPLFAETGKPLPVSCPYCLLVAPALPTQETASALVDSWDEDDKARDAAWSVLKLQLDPKGWTVGESFTFHEFFAWGWEARRQYDTPTQ
jgi:hypothetical protein